MNDTNDDLIDRLANADPIDPGTIPSGTDNAPQQILENILMENLPSAGDSERASTIQDPDEPVELLGLPAVRDIDRYQRPRRSRMRVLATVAAALLVAVGFVVFSPDNTPPALATVHGAAQAMAEIDSGRVSSTLTFTADGNDGSDSGSAQGIVVAEFSGNDIAITGTIDEVSGEADGEFPSEGELRLVDGVVYLSENDSWVGMDTGGLIGQTVVDFVDPRSVLREIEDLVETTALGDVTIDGLDTTHYQSIVDISEESFRESGWLPVETAAADFDVEGQMVVDLYIDGDGVLRRLTANGDIAEPGGDASATFTITTDFFDLGADISIEAPASATLIEPEADFDLDSFDLDSLDLDG